VTQCPDGIGHACSLDALLGEADILSLHLPLASNSRHVMNDERFSRMKQGASLINTSRGALVDNASLLRALETGQLAQALLDVQEQEPDIARSLLEHDRVALTPHAAFYSRQSLAALKGQALQTLLEDDSASRAYEPRTQGGEVGAHV